MYSFAYKSLPTTAETIFIDKLKEKLYETIGKQSSSDYGSRLRNR
jgi:hypothetical protein